MRVASMWLEKCWDMASVLGMVVDFGSVFSRYVCRLQVSAYEAALALHKALYRYICSAFSGKGDVYSPPPLCQSDAETKISIAMHGFAKKNLSCAIVPFALDF